MRICSPEKMSLKHDLHVGGFLTGKFLSMQDVGTAEKGGRFDKDTAHGKHYSWMYINNDNIQAVKMVQEAAVRILCHVHKTIGGCYPLFLSM